MDSSPSGVRVYGVPATRLAEELGRKMVLNIVMVGFFGAVTACSTPRRCARPWRIRCPPAIRELNLQAFDKGYENGATLLHARAEGSSDVEGWAEYLGQEA